MRVFVMMSKSHKTTNEREREKGKQKREKKADGNARLKSHEKRAHEQTTGERVHQFLRSFCTFFLLCV
tara:strand:+ start:405 stop:608 length:204 start_codon:yes stop_codon:yes gene_type:complete